MTKSRCLKLLRRLIPAVARREAYVCRQHGKTCEAGFQILTERGDNGARERHAMARGKSWAEVYRKVAAIVEGPRGEA